MVFVLPRFSQREAFSSLLFHSWIYILGHRKMEGEINWPLSSFGGLIFFFLFLVANEKTLFKQIEDHRSNFIAKNRLEVFWYNLIWHFPEGKGECLLEGIFWVKGKHASHLGFTFLDFRSVLYMTNCFRTVFDIKKWRREEDGLWRA